MWSDGLPEVILPRKQSFKADSVGDVLASAGDDGNVITWVLDSKTAKPTFGDEGTEDKEAWRTKHMCRSSGAEIYDLAWSPDGIYFITGSMDNVARIYNAQTGMPKF